jgi:hypothetical protein
MLALFERIGHVEHERGQLRATRIEDGLTIARLQQENDKLKLLPMLPVIF